MMTPAEVREFNSQLLGGDARTEMEQRIGMAVEANEERQRRMKKMRLSPEKDRPKD